MRVTFEGVHYDGAALLAALYNNTQAVGLGVLHDSPTPMTVAQAQQILDSSHAHYKNGHRDRAHGFVFDWVWGRPIKVVANAEQVIEAESERLYDRDAGQGAFRRALVEATRAS